MKIFLLASLNGGADRVNEMRRRLKGSLRISSIVGGGFWTVCRFTGEPGLDPAVETGREGGFVCEPKPKKVHHRKTNASTPRIRAAISFFFSPGLSRSTRCIFSLLPGCRWLIHPPNVESKSTYPVADLLRHCVAENHPTRWPIPSARQLLVPIRLS